MARPIFCGNFDFEARASDLERLFKRHGKVDRVDMKNGFAFIYMDDERDAGYAIRALDRTEFGRKGRRLRVEWTKHEQGGRKPVSSRKSANLRPSKTLFIINFPSHTTTRDLERHFDPYGKIVNVRIRGNFGFVQYDSQEDATKALDATNMSKFLDRVITVEYSSRGDDDSRRNGYSPDRRVRDRSPDGRRRSPSPYRRERGSPDYGVGPNAISYRRERGSPVYGNGSSRSPRRLQRVSPGYNRKRSLTPRRDVRASPQYRSRGRSRSRSPRGEDNGNGYGRQSSLVDSDREEGAILDDDPEPASPIRRPNSMDRPIGISRSPVDKNRYQSRSPLARDRRVGESRSPVDNSRSPAVRERSQS